MTPAQRSLRAKLAAHSRWAKTGDRRAAIEPAMRGQWAALARQVDPDGQLSPDELHQRVKSAMAAKMHGLALKSSKARSKGASS